MIKLQTQIQKHSRLKVEGVGQTHSSIVTACSYARVAFSTSSKLVRATVKNKYEV